MLSTARCRTLLGPDCSLSEAELERLRQDLYSLAEVALESISCLRTLLVTSALRNSEPLLDSPGAGPLPQRVTTSPDDEYEATERAAILEFDACMSRSEAEDEANLRSKNHLSKWVKPHS